jgi:hypothetical protein
VVCFLVICRISVAQKFHFLLHRVSKIYAVCKTSLAHTFHFHINFLVLFSFSCNYVPLLWIVFTITKLFLFLLLDIICSILHCSTSGSQSQNDACKAPIYHYVVDPSPTPFSQTPSLIHLIPSKHPLLFHSTTSLCHFVKHLHFCFPTYTNLATPPLTTLLHPTPFRQVPFFFNQRGSHNPFFFFFLKKKLHFLGVPSLCHHVL